MWGRRHDSRRLLRTMNRRPAGASTLILFLHRRSDAVAQPLHAMKNAVQRP